MEGHSTDASDFKIFPANLKRIIRAGVDHSTDGEFFTHITYPLYRICARVEINPNLPVDHPSQQPKIGMPVINMIREMFPLWDDTYVEAGRRFVVSYLHRRYRRKMGITESGRPRPPNSSKSGHFAPSSRSSPPGRSKKRPYQATRAAAPPPPSPRSAGSSQSPSHGRAGTRSPTPAQSSTSGTRNDNRRPPANLLAVRTFLESCSPGLGDLAPLFIDYGCDSRKYFVEISTWSEKDIYAFLNRVASHRMANPNAFVTMRPMDIELIARRCLELGKEKKI